MNKIDALFLEKKNILSVYFTAGFPHLEDTSRVLEELSSSGVDMIEIGIPFSDPLADGPVIQHSSEVALQNGMTLKILFEQLQQRQITQLQSRIPLLLMGYLNPVLQYGIEAFCKSAQEAGISGVIIPDLPLDEYLKEYKTHFDAHHLHNIFLITPQTDEKRIRWIDSHSTGFIYMVSSSSTTGMKNGIDADQESYFARIKSLGLRNPLIIGFGISDSTSFNKACEYADGAIIGSAFIKALENKISIHHFINNLR